MPEVSALDGRYGARFHVVLRKTERWDNHAGPEMWTNLRLVGPPHNLEVPVVQNQSRLQGPHLSADQIIDK